MGKNILSYSYRNAAVTIKVHKCGNLIMMDVTWVFSATYLFIAVCMYLHLALFPITGELVVRNS
jgi:hypothetical protein